MSLKLLNVEFVEISEGPLTFRVRIWWEDAKVPTVHEKSPEAATMLSVTVPETS